MRTFAILLLTVALAGTALAHVQLDTPNGKTFYAPDQGDATNFALGGNHDMTFYQETNGCPGLQTEPSDCDGSGRELPADASLVSLE